MSKQAGGGHAQGSKLAVVILAAGKGTRFKTSRQKVLENLGGRPLVRHVIAAAAQVAAARDILVVTGHGSEQVRDAVADTGVQFVEQAQICGTAHALQCARGAIAGYGEILVVPADMPLLNGDTLARLLQIHVAVGAAMTKLVATKNKSAKQQEDSGVYAFRVKELLAHLGDLKASKKQGDVDLDALDPLLRNAGHLVAFTPVDKPDEVSGADTVAELAALDAGVRMAVARRWMDAGVVIYRPETCVIDVDVTIEPDTILEPFVQLLGSTKIGSGCRVRSYSVLENCTLGNQVIIRPHCVLADSTIADRAEIGPFARIRPGCEVGEQVHIGNFVELKKAKLSKGVKAGHLSYLGDTEIGEDVNIGAGVITCNYDGVHKHQTKIGDGAFIGSDSTLVAPVSIGEGAYVGAGSCITREVPADALAIGRAHQVIKEGWAAERRARRKAKA